MAKSKTPTPQELYRARKQREERERTAFLPPGLFNHGNTCFMNSVLQGLIATQLLADLAHFRPISPSIQNYSNPPLASRRSPLLTNGHKQGGQFEQGWVNTMPIGDIFLDMILRAWHGQSRRTRENLSPKLLLGVLGRKYEQYLDFAQQDAHEFLRILLDAIRMEELDVIKKRQPPPETVKKKRRTTITPSGINSVSPHQDETSERLPADGENKLVPLVDMAFGGKLTSILVCQKCKHVSQTYEDFNDISLSIKAEDYHQRKRDRLKNFAKRLTSFPTTSLTVGSDVPRPSSVPPSPRERETQQFGGHDEPLNIDEPRRKSLDILTDPVQDSGGEQGTVLKGDVTRRGLDIIDAIQDTGGESEVNVVERASNGSAISTNGDAASGGKHIEISSTQVEKKEKKEKKDDGWAKISKRISMTVGFGKVSKERTGRSKDRSSQELSSGQIDTPKTQINSDNGPGTSVTSTQKTNASEAIHDTTSPPSTYPSSPPSQISEDDRRTPSPSLPSHSLNLMTPRVSHVQRTKSPKPPKPTTAELDYLREILADITPASSSNPFAVFKPTYHHNGSRSSVATGSSVPPIQPPWLHMGHFSGIEECLRMFTSVEILDGENMVGCRRCWKIANGDYYTQSGDEEGNGDGDSDSTDQNSANMHPRKSSVNSGRSRPSLSPLSPPSMHIPISISTPTVSFYSQSNSGDRRSVSSLPTEVSLTSESDIDISHPTVKLVSNADQSPATPGGLPIPFISTTAPDSPTAQAHRPPPNGVSPPQLVDRSMSRTSVDAEISIQHPTPRLGRVLSHLQSLSSTDSLPIPKIRHQQYKLELDTDESSAESEVSATTSTSTRSLESSTSMHITTRNSESSSTSHSAVPRKPSRPKPVIMRPAYKRYLIDTPPPVLVIHLKRFQHTSKSHIMSFSHGFKKLDDYVTFPEFLDLTPYLAPKKEDFGLGKHKVKLPSRRRTKHTEKCMYRLYAVVVHIGNMLGGHYIAYTALPDPIASANNPSSTTHKPGSSPLGPQRTRQWAYISDTIVRLTTLEEVLKAKAYICMYERI